MILPPQPPRVRRSPAACPARLSGGQAATPRPRLPPAEPPSVLVVRIRDVAPSPLLHGARSARFFFGMGPRSACGLAGPGTWLQRAWTRSCPRGPWSWKSPPPRGAGTVHRSRTRAILPAPPQTDDSQMIPPPPPPAGCCPRPPRPPHRASPRPRPLRRRPV